MKKIFKPKHSQITSYVNHTRGCHTHILMCRVALYRIKADAPDLLNIQKMCAYPRWPKYNWQSLTSLNHILNVSKYRLSDWPAINIRKICKLVKSHLQFHLKERDQSRRYYTWYKNNLMRPPSQLKQLSSSAHVMAIKI